MKKMTKGAIVTGLGVALLLGGGGTLATWNMDKSANAGTIQSGKMTLNVTEESPWSSKITGQKVATDHKIIPGEVLTYNQDVVVGKDGEGLRAALKVIGISKIVQGADGTNSFGNTLTPVISVKDPNGQPLTLTSDNFHGDTYTLDSDAKVGTYTVTATLAFNADNEDAMNATLNLNSIEFQLQQQ